MGLLPGKNPRRTGRDFGPNWAGIWGSAWEQVFNNLRCSVILPDGPGGGLGGSESLDGSPGDSFYWKDLERKSDQRQP